MNTAQMILSIVSGLAVCIPLVVKLIEYVTNNVRAKNYPALIQLVTKYMSEAETLFKTGAEKKDWVMRMVESSADTVNFDIDMSVVSELIDNLCAMSKQVNAKEV